ncbi:ComEA family DNA-binding protein [Candidatus Dojkabacteria bacterium]|uniref:ComEA family DNA-binding protein n=1 Tax=Candidatus Dojkabacteria bacterium TaxID=2099670 RepID=A0A955LAS5_9BACT|nr:ComEA family DNA-binding protein [Candidatus Dojkabacteria bacterium]
MKKKIVVQNIALTFVALLFLFGFVLAYKYQNQDIPQIQFTKAPEFDFLDTDYAYISGAVTKPGVYEINQSTRIIDLVMMAQGFNNNTDEAFVAKSINLAKLVEDSEHIFIPAKETVVKKDNVTDQDTQSTNALININTASSTELETLPGVGSATASKIINNRPYNKINDLLKVKGIGQATLDKISPLVSL